MLSSFLKTVSLGIGLMIWGGVSAHALTPICSSHSDMPLSGCVYVVSSQTGEGDANEAGAAERGSLEFRFYAPSQGTAQPYLPTDIYFVVRKHVSHGVYHDIGAMNFADFTHMISALVVDYNNFWDALRTGLGSRGMYRVIPSLPAVLSSVGIYAATTGAFYGLSLLRGSERRIVRGVGTLFDNLFAVQTMRSGGHAFAFLMFAQMTYRPLYEAVKEHVNTSRYGTRERFQRLLQATLPLMGGCVLSPANCGQIQSALNTTTTASLAAMVERIGRAAATGGQSADENDFVPSTASQQSGPAAAQRNGSFAFSSPLELSIVRSWYEGGSEAEPELHASKVLRAPDMHLLEQTVESFFRPQNSEMIDPDQIGFLVRRSDIPETQRSGHH